MSKSVKSLSDLKKPEPEKKENGNISRTKQQAPDKLKKMKDKPKTKRGDNPDAFGF